MSCANLCNTVSQVVVWYNCVKVQCIDSHKAALYTYGQRADRRVNQMRTCRNTLT